MRRAPLVLGIVLLFGGTVWVAQGLNLPFAPRSFMTADSAWVVIGALTALGGVMLIGFAQRRSR